MHIKTDCLSLKPKKNYQGFGIEDVANSSVTRVGLYGKH